MQGGLSGAEQGLTFHPLPMVRTGKSHWSPPSRLREHALSHALSHAAMQPGENGMALGRGCTDVDGSSEIPTCWMEEWLARVPHEEAPVIPL